MKKITLVIAGALAMTAMAPATRAAEVNGWGDFKLYIDPGHEGLSNQGLWGYSEAEKVLDVALNIKQMLEAYTDMPAENLKLCRYTVDDRIDLEERSDEANAWGADFYYSIHSDAGNIANEIVLLFGGWRKDGVAIEKTPHGGKAYGEKLEPNLSGVMRIKSRGNWHDRCFYDKGTQTHANQYPYLSVNRRSNMPSLLSEGGFHTIASQQQRNLNGDYRRLEALAAFQSILQYRGLALPAQTFLHGVVSNSENDQPINGATVTVDGKTYTTDTYEDLFKKYSNNPNLIHNGLFTFEGLEAGKEYEVVFAAPGFEGVTKKVTIKGGGEHTPDYVTFLDVALTNVAPAKVDAVSVENPDKVSPVYPIVITFSRNMDRASVEQAFSINNDGEVELKWINDYTLSVNIEQLLPLWDYTFTIKGDVAKNSQTNQLFDGDGDGEPGGDWTYSFVMAEPDLTAPEVVSTYPAAEGEALYFTQFPIRIEYDEIINWNDDKNADCITVKDSDGKVYAGQVTHAVVREQSVLHFYANEAYPADKTILVSVAPGLADLTGNTTTEPFHFRFMTEHRPLKEEGSAVIFDCKNESGFWAPGGSGSSKGLIIEESSTTSMPVNPFTANGTSMSMNYTFDEADAGNYWFVRLYTPNTNSTANKDFDVVLTYWIYGDGSNNLANMLVRIPNSSGGLKYRKENMPIDFRGWNLFAWDLMNDEYGHFTGDQVMGQTGTWRFDAFTMEHKYSDPDDEDEPQTAWNGSLGYSTLRYNKFDNTVERGAKLTDLDLPGAVEEVEAAQDITVAVGVDAVTVSAAGTIDNAAIHAVDGTLAARAATRANMAVIPTAHLAKGVYVVTVKAGNATRTVKFVK